MWLQVYQVLEIVQPGLWSLTFTSVCVFPLICFFVCLQRATSYRAFIIANTSVQCSFEGIFQGLGKSNSCFNYLASCQGQHFTITYHDDKQRKTNQTNNFPICSLPPRVLNSDGTKCDSCSHFSELDPYTESLFGWCPLLSRLSDPLTQENNHMFLSKRFHSLGAEKFHPLSRNGWQTISHICFGFSSLEYFIGYACVSAHVCASMWRPGNNSEYLSSGTTHPFLTFWDGVFLWPGALQVC